MKTKRIIFLDLDETLIDTSERHYQVYCDIMNTLNLDGTINKDEFWKLKRNGIPSLEILKETDTKVLKKFSELWINNIEKRDYLLYDTPFNETYTLLSELSKERLILITMRNNRENLIWELKKLGLHDKFEFILSCSSLENKDKTVPLLEYIHNKKFTLESNSIIVGDSEIDIITGKKFNIITLAVSYGIRTRAFLISMNPDYCLKDMDEVVDTIKNLK